MTETSNSTDDFFLNSGSEQLKKIHGWAKSRMAAPWAVFAGVLLRVAASVPPYVQLPGVIGDRASLNLLCAFVGPSGSGKGNATKVAALAWPTDILTLPVGSGQGIAEAFTKRDPKDEIHPVIFDIPEIDTMTGLSSTQGSILLPTIKSLAMGEQLGQANATKDARRVVAAHSYRGCLSVSAQPGHTNVIFNDTTGGTPQRFLWMPVTDPNIEYGDFPDPNPLVTDPPIWTPGKDGVVDIDYSAVPDIEIAIRQAQYDKSRGVGDPLDGHAVLTRCKVAALLAIMHQRAEVTEEDWVLSAAVMAVSNETRRGLREYAEEVKRQRALDAGNTRAIEREGYEDGRLRSVTRAIVDRLTDAGGEMANSELRTRLTSGQRPLFGAAVGKLADDGVIEVVTVKNGKRYRLKDTRQGGDPRQGTFVQFSEGGDACQGGGVGTALRLENARSQKSGTRKLSCQQWFNNHIAELCAAGESTAESFAVNAAGRAAGYSNSNLGVAKAHRPDITVIESRGRNGSTWSLLGVA